MKRIVLLVAMLAMSVFLVAPAALAQGQVERGPAHANSICSFSGLNDDPAEGGRVQSYGQLVRQGAAERGDQPGRAEPGSECNPTTGPSGPF